MLGPWLFCQPACQGVTITKMTPPVACNVHIVTFATATFQTLSLCRQLNVSQSDLTYWIGVNCRIHGRPTIITPHLLCKKASVLVLVTSVVHSAREHLARIGAYPSTAVGDATWPMRVSMVFLPAYMQYLCYVESSKRVIEVKLMMVTDEMRCVTERSEVRTDSDASSTLMCMCTLLNQQPAPARNLRIRTPESSSNYDLS